MLNYRFDFIGNFLVFELSIILQNYILLKPIWPLMEHDWRQRVVRIYDPDHHIMEIGEDMDYVQMIIEN